jgi:glycosyltransferase involved in cell wall biosynthesis
MAATPSVSVIIATSSRTNHLDLTLASFTRQSGVDFELIVVHPGSDYTAGLVDKHGAGRAWRCLNAGETGRGAARNAGIRAADGDLIVIADDARIVPADWLAQVAAPDCVSVSERRGIIPRWNYFLPGATAKRLLNLMRRRTGVGAMLYEGMEHFFGADELTQHFDDIVGGYAIDDFVWDRLGPVAERAARGELHLPWLLALAGNACVPRRALFEVGLCDPAFYGWDLEDPELGYKLHRHGLGFRVVNAPSWHQQRPFLTYPFCMLESLQRFAAAHDPVDAWLLLRFLTDDDLGGIDAVAAARPRNGHASLVDNELKRSARELVPHLIHALGRWWAQDTGR